MKPARSRRCRKRRCNSGGAPGADGGRRLNQTLARLERDADLFQVTLATFGQVLQRDLPLCEEGLEGLQSVVAQPVGDVLVGDPAIVDFFGIACDSISPSPKLPNASYVLVIPDPLICGNQWEVESPRRSDG